MVNDTWEWDGADWVQRFTASSPTPCDGHGMAYDPERGVVAMFGGSTDTWEYAPTQPGEYVAFGQGCAGTQGTPTLSAVHGLRPYLGSALVVEATHLGSGPAVLTIGASRGSWMGVTLPIDLGVIGAPGCSLLSSVELTAPIASVGGSGRQAFAIPLDPTLVGKRFYDQVIAFDGFPNPTGLALSNGEAGLIGAK